MRLSKITFQIISKVALVMVLAALVMAIAGILLGDSLILPWYSIPTFVKTPLFLEYFRIEGQSFGFNMDQVLVWQHFSTGAYEYLAWADYAVLISLFVSLVTISVTLSYLERSWFLFCTGLMLLFIMQLNLSELGLLPDSINYIALIVFGVPTYYFQSIKPESSLFFRTLCILTIYAAAFMAVGQLAPILVPVSGAVAFGLFTPLMIAALLMLFVNGDTMNVLFSLATKNAPSGKNGLIHFMSIALIYLILVALLFLDKIGYFSFELWLISPYLLLMVSLVCGYLSLNAKTELSDSALPESLIKKWLYPVLAALSLVLIGYAELTGNDSLRESFELCILITQLGGAIVFFVYALINFTPILLEDEVVPNFFAGERAPLLTARVMSLVFVAGAFFYMDSTPYYQAKAGRYIALGALGESIDSELLSSQYYKQASFYDYYNFKANYALARIAKKERNEADLKDYLVNAAVRDKQSKAKVALANYYSDRDQLFAKLRTLKNSRNVTHRVTNNLGIAHFEFQQYDSALMAFDRSISLADTEEAVANQLALRYHFTSYDEEVNQPETVLAKVNAQALANRQGTALDYSSSLPTDSILVQEELFHLYNHSLNQEHPQNPQLISGLSHYLSHVRNRALKDFLLPAQAIQEYQAGNINTAVNSLREAIVADPKKAAKHHFALGLWAAHQGANVLAIEHLNEAMSDETLTAEIDRLKAAIESGNIPVQTRTPDDTEGLQTRAGKNAFDEVLTLGAISGLKEEGLSTQALYELLRTAVTINKYSLPINEAYAQMSVEAGLSSFGRSALEALRGLVDDERLNDALADFEQKLEAWRSRPPE